jgi:hypothetical protein
MFARTSRYTGTKIVKNIAYDGRKVDAVFVRRIRQVEGIPVAISGSERLDIIASDKYKDATRFWHIADANTELDANELVKKSSTVRKILVPER